MKGGNIILGLAIILGLFCLYKEVTSEADDSERIILYKER